MDKKKIDIKIVIVIQQRQRHSKNDTVALTTAAMYKNDILN